MNEEIITNFSDLLSKGKLPSDVTINGQVLNIRKGIKGSINNQYDKLSETNNIGRNLEFTIENDVKEIPVAIQLYKNTSGYYRLFTLTNRGLLFSVNLSSGEDGQLIVLKQQIRLSTRKINKAERENNTQLTILALEKEKYFIDGNRWIHVGAYDKTKKKFIDTTADKFINDFIKISLIKGHYSRNKGFSIQSL